MSALPVNSLRDALPVADVFAAWAPVYDTEPNPLLALEDRYLSRLLPNIAGRDVLDVGCGTGRRLSCLALMNPASLRGFDPSPAMLQAAHARQLPGVQLTPAGLPALPVASAGADCVLVSFVLGYVSDLPAAVAELARILRAGGDLFLSDMHPGTAALLGWTRGTASAPASATPWPLAGIERLFLESGFTLAARLLLPFGEPEQPLFTSSGKQAAWEAAIGHPAIYLLHLRKQAPPTRSFSLDGHACALGPHKTVSASLAIADGRVASILGDASASTDDLDLTGYLLLPGLINAHDHLEFALFPRLGSGAYPDSTAWARDIQVRDRDTIARHKQVPLQTRLWWGGLRNLLCGATTVCHHNPLYPTLRDPAFPIRVLARYGWAHSLTFAPGIPDALHETGPDEPFFLHACEGLSPSASRELAQLDALSALDARTVLIHGLALDHDGAVLLNRRGASLVICPSSNAFLFGQTHPELVLRSVERLLLGSDSPLTAAGDLLDELRFASTLGLQPEQLYGMVTDRPAPMLRFTEGEGTLRPGARADCIAVRARLGSPADILAQLSWRDIELVVLGGKVVLASETLYARLPPEIQRVLNPLLVEDTLRWLRAPVTALLEAAEAVLGEGNVYLNGRRLTRVEAHDAR